uniref:BTB domain-containing protein n=1 Tax=Cacopsylla melanoneura TaxID=428564 RepID=A0A8D8PM35_9HEMI
MSSGPPRTIQRNMVPVLARMFNNPEFSNLKILVNNDTFYAEKNFLRVSSLVWEVLLGSLSSTHRMIEYRIDRIRDSESILTILKFVYGVPINFTRLPDLVLLEVVGLADMLLYMEFHKDLLAYIDKHRPQLIGAELPPREETDGGGQVEGSGGQVVRDREQVEASGEQTESNSETARVTSELDNINLNSESDDSTQHYYVCNSEY